MGNSGILKRAAEAVETNEKATAIEQVSMAWVACQTDYLASGLAQDKTIFFTKENLNANLSEGEITGVSVGVDTSGTSELVYKKDDLYYKIQITVDGEVSIVGEPESTTRKYNSNNKRPSSA